MSTLKCCVPNCGKTRLDGEILHTFPHYEKEPERFWTWVYAIGGEILALNNKVILHSKRVCHSHFEPSFCTASKRLSSNALPTLCLSVDFKSNYESTVENPHNDNSTDPLTTDVKIDMDDKETDHPELQDSQYDSFTWQKEAIICTDDEDNNVNEEGEIPLRYESDDFKEQATLMDLMTSVESDHAEYCCNECGDDIVGVRYVCVQCADYDVCASCEARGAHAMHYALRVPQDKHTDEVIKFVMTIRKCIDDDSSLILLPASERVKIEVKDEEEEQLVQEECKADLVPRAQSPESCRVPDLHPASTEPTAPITDLHTSNPQPFLFNASSTQDTGNIKLHHRTSKDQNYLMASDDINNSVASDPESDIMLPSYCGTQKTELNFNCRNKIKPTNHFTKQMSDLKKSKELLVKLVKLDCENNELFTRKRSKR